MARRRSATRQACSAHLGSRASGAALSGDSGGPGHITAYLDALGLAAFGVDASPAMIKLARHVYPGLRFDVGSMTAVNVADGVLSRWSIIHTPPQELPAILAEFHRVLAPGGHLLIGFSASDDPSYPTQFSLVTGSFGCGRDGAAGDVREHWHAEVDGLIWASLSSVPARLTLRLPRSRRASPRARPARCGRAGWPNICRRFQAGHTR
jgi:SAM-dependent methyltransferase